MFWGPLALVTATGAMLALPLTPALLELRNRRDAAPLTTRLDDGNIRAFAESFRNYISPLQPMLTEVAKSRSVKETAPAASTAILIGRPGYYDFGTPTVGSLVLCAGDVAFPSSVSFLGDMYVGGALSGGNADVFRAVLCDGDVILGDRSIVLRWMHAKGVISTGTYSELYGRLSSEERVTLGHGARFERVSAPRILAAIEEAPTHLRRSSMFGRRSIMDLLFGRLCANGDFHLAAGDMLQGHVIAAGAVRIDEGTRIIGSIKSHKSALVGARAEIHGTVASASELNIGASCYVRGPVLAEGELIIGPDTQIGSTDSPTTVSAPSVTIAPGAVIYGSIWARTQGRVQG
jgi:predicted acyltransferase (DUF342 family)